MKDMTQGATMHPDQSGVSSQDMAKAKQCENSCKNQHGGAGNICSQPMMGKE